MNRRDVFRMLSALPLIGSWFVAPVAAATSVAKPARQMSLAAVRDLLLPAFHNFRVNAPYDVDFDIQRDHANDCLIVKGYRFSHTRVLGFVITRASIDSGRVIDEFRLNMVKLMECLYNDGLHAEIVGMSIWNPEMD